MNAWVVVPWTAEQPLLLLKEERAVFPHNFFSIYLSLKHKLVPLFSSFGDSKMNTLYCYLEILPLGICSRKISHFCWIVPISFQKASDVKTCVKSWKSEARNQWDVDLLFLTTFTLYSFLFSGHYLWVTWRVLLKAMTWPCQTPHTSQWSSCRALQWLCKTEYSATKQGKLYKLPAQAVNLIQQCGFQRDYGRGGGKMSLLVVLMLTFLGCICAFSRMLA